jgi:Tetraspanin family
MYNFRLPSRTLQLCGMTVMIVGLWLYVNQDAINYTRLLHDNPTSPLIIFDKVPFVCLAAGFTLTVVSFLGCCGACAESVCFLSFVSMADHVIIARDEVLRAQFLTVHAKTTSWGGGLNDDSRVL